MSDSTGQAISSGSHPVLALSKMKSLREKSALCDVTLDVGATRIPAHRVILAASSPYFEFMFTSLPGDVTESSKDIIEIKGFCPKAFLAVVDFMYSGYLFANEETIIDLLKVADFLKIATAKEQCLNYLQKHINVANCVMIRNIARNHFFLELEKKVNSFISHNFFGVIKSRGFLELSFDELKNFITEDSFCCNESICEKTISAWIGHNKSSREEFKENLCQVANVYTASREKRSLNVYNASQHNRIFFFYELPDFSWAFDLSNSTWHCVRGRPILAHIQPLFHDDSICLISDNKNECGIYNLKEEKWTSNIMPFKNTYSGGCSNHNRIYLTELEDSRDIFSYDVERNALHREPPLIRKRTDPGIIFNENCIYVCGGACSSAEFRDIRTKDWKSISNLPKGAENISVTSLNDKVYCLSSSKNLFHYDKCKGVWVKKASIPTKPTPRDEKNINSTKRYTIGSTDEALYAICEGMFYTYDPNKDEWKVLISSLNATDFTCVFPRL